jgi:hypothetical protein
LFAVPTGPAAHDPAGFIVYRPHSNPIGLEGHQFSSDDLEVAKMAAIAKVLSRTKSWDEGAASFQMLAIFCLTGLAASVLLTNCAINLGIDWPPVNF